MEATSRERKKKWKIKHNPKCNHSEINHTGIQAPGKLASVLKRHIEAEGWPQTYSQEGKEKLASVSPPLVGTAENKGLSQSLVIHAGEHEKVG